MVIILIAVILVAYLLSTFCGKTNPGLQSFRGWAYAHRGLYGDEAPENSLEAFRRAREAGYGVELDVHLLADGNLAVIHDSSLLRMTGLDRRIEELSAWQLTQLHLLETTETIPLLTDVLDMFQGKVPLIIELKSQPNNYKQLCAKVYEVLQQYNGMYCVESFDPRCVYWFRKNHPDVVRGQLVENYFANARSKVPFVLKVALVAQMFNFITRPNFVAYKFCDRRNLSDFIVRKLWRIPSVTWTVTSIEDYNVALSEARIPIFENFNP